MSDPDDVEDSEEKPSEYAMLECWSFETEDFTRIASYPAVEGVEGWYSGQPFEAKVKEPIRLQWDPHSTGPKKSYYKPIIPLFRKDLLKALREAGVDNLDCYQTEISDTKAQGDSHEYLAVNVIGLVAAADLSLSEYADPSGTGLIDMDFDLLVIDPKKARGMKMFRLAECASGIVIHQSVKKHLESKGGFGLTFVLPEEWIG